MIAANLAGHTQLARGGRIPKALRWLAEEGFSIIISPPESYTPCPVEVSAIAWKGKAQREPPIVPASLDLHTERPQRGRRGLSNI